MFYKTGTDDNEHMDVWKPDMPGAENADVTTEWTPIDPLVKQSLDVFQLRKTKFIDKIFVSTDSEETAKMAMQTTIIQAVYTDMRNDLPKFRTGDKISVGYRVIEGSRSRVQTFEGVVIKISSGHGLDKTFTVRKISGGIGVERIFPVHSPNIESIKVLKEGKVRRAKLYYLRSRKGKATRIKEKT